MMAMKPSFPWRQWMAWAAIPVTIALSLCVPAPWQPGWIIAAGLACVIACGVIAIPRGVEPHARARTRPMDPDGTLPVIVVVGPHSTHFFRGLKQGDVLRREQEAVWLHAGTPTQLADVVAQIKASRGRGPDAALLPVVPDADDDVVLRREFSNWRHVLQGLICHPESVLPTWLAVYACLSRSLGDSPEPQWYGAPIDLGAGAPSAGARLTQCVSELRERLMSPGQAHVADTARSRVLGGALLDWLDDVGVLPALSSLANTPPFALRGVLLADIRRDPVRSGAWARWLTARTGLRAVAANPTRDALAVPPVVTPTSPRSRPRLEAVARRGRFIPELLVSAVLAIGLAVCVSGASNRRLIAQVGSDIETFLQTPDDTIDAKRRAYDQLMRDRLHIDRTIQEGVPARLGWGLYQGAPLSTKLRDVLTRYPPPSLTQQIDSLALFASGSAKFSPDSNQQELRRVLLWINANPGYRVLITGHADSEGSPQANIRLSEARARAIRDWLVAQGGLPVTRIAVQGEGDTHPIAGNDSASGRARNRRVEISLLPDDPAPRSGSKFEDAWRRRVP
jgi:outer membrane protein OmpA-like peptidoglycan-associated protein